jgi:hypothetical protein
MTRRLRVKSQIRILFAVAAVALAAGWLGLRRGNAALEAKTELGAGRTEASGAAPTPEVSR